MSKGQFKTGMEPWNKGLTGYMGSNPTSFKKENLPPQTLPKGTIKRWQRTKNGRSEVTYIINIDWKGFRKSHNSYKWYLWEVANQTNRPEGMILAVINGNPDDIRLDNLELISRAENMRRNSKHKGYLI